MTVLRRHTLLNKNEYESLMSKAIIPIGTRFSKLVVISDAPPRVRDGCAERMYWCRCDCGTEKIVRSIALRTDDRPTHSCGCLAHTGDSMRTHGLSKTSTYYAWGHIRQRCYNQNSPDYPDYGGRGIVVCERWRHSFEAFLADMGERPTGLTIHRINNDGNYELGNCKWATGEEQARNKRNTTIVTVRGKTGALADVAEHFGISYKLARSRLSRGMEAEVAFFRPKGRWLNETSKHLP